MNLGKALIVFILLAAVRCQAQSSAPAPQPAQPTPPSAEPAAQPAQPAAPTAEQAGQPAQPAAQPVQPAAQPAQTAPPAPTLAASSDTYVIGASDVITVTVWKDQTLSGTLLVRLDGMISMPLLGDVKASGLTPAQLSDQIAGKLKKFMQDPQVSIVVAQIHSKIVYFLGEVQKRGPIEMTPGMTLLQAIGCAGGLSDYANTKKMYILRSEAGKQERIPVHYKEALKGNAEMNLVLKPGDTIVVP